ncbi:MAG: hypothetical protein ACON5F_12130 [Jejuia sp.]
MKKIVLTLGLVITGLSISAQHLKVNDTLYDVKKGVILREGIDITNILSKERKTEILTAFNSQQQELAKEKAIKDKLESAEQEQKKAEKQQKRAEKKQKKAEKALRQKEKAQANYDKAISKYDNAQKKYEKLKKKGKLSPVDEANWLEKIEKFSENVTKTKRKLK